jgi:hypothetical protein
MFGYVHKNGGGGKTAGVDGPVNPQGAAALEQGQKRLRLAEWFASGDGYPATCLIIKGQIFFDLKQKLFCGHLPAGCFMGQGGTGCNTALAEGAAFLVSMYAVHSELQRLALTYIDTLFAANTFVAKRYDMYLKVYPFRIMTPVTCQRATFEKNGRPDIRPIMQGIPFNGKNCCNVHMNTINNKSHSHAMELSPCMYFCVEAVVSPGKGS